jgi:Phytochelatin synthase
MLVNYERAALSQDKTGHISPIAAYNAKTDRLLILDVATYKYPSVWVSTEALWKAMNTVDSASGRSRGFAVVRRPSRRRRRWHRRHAGLSEGIAGRPLPERSGRMVLFFLCSAR